MGGKSLLTRYGSTKRGAIVRGLSFDLTVRQFASLIGRECVYCGLKSNFNGIDRVDSKIGYIIENCVPCCGTCNVMKMAQSVDEFIQRCRRITARSFSTAFHENPALHYGEWTPERFLPIE
jgi:hypothetical protein